jgi:hypothetical protein
VRSFLNCFFDKMLAILAHAFILMWLIKGFLLHAKSTGPEKTFGWSERCSRRGVGIAKSSSCQVGIPSHELILGGYNISEREDNGVISAAFESNCFRHGKIMKDYVPRLELALKASTIPA